MAGSAYYEQANYKDSVKEFNEAYRLSGRTDLLYNIALCYEHLGDWDAAIESLRKYLNDKPEAQDRAIIQTRIGNLERRRAQIAPAPAPTPAPVSVLVSARSPSKPRYLGGPIALSLGLAALASSIGTGAAALRLDEDLRARCLGGVCVPADRDEVDRGRALALSTDVLIGIGAAAVVVGVVLFIVESRRVKN